MFLGKLIMGIGYTAVKSKIKVGRGKILGWGEGVGGRQKEV